MKKLIFTVKGFKNSKEIASLAKEISQINCRIKLDMKNSKVIIEKAKGIMIDKVIELINRYFNIETMEMDNTEENSIKTQKVNLDVKGKYEKIEEQIKKFLEVAEIVIEKSGETEEVIGEYISAVIDEIKMEYGMAGKIAFEIGDVVACNYGRHLKGEIQGKSVKTVVCDIDDKGLVYVVPIFGITKNEEPYISYYSKEILSSGKLNCKKVRFVTNRGKYVRPERIYKVIGKIKPEILDIIKSEVPMKFKSNSKKEGNLTEIAIEEIVGKYLDKINYKYDLENQIITFLNEIKMNQTSEMIQFFIVTCNMQTITYEKVFLELGIDKEQKMIKKKLDENFKEWINNYPQVKERYPHISLVTLLKVFSKRYNRSLI